jgi:large subunit ribosomal protein L4
VGGGVVLEKKPRDFSQKINKQMKAAALVSALSGKVQDGDFIILNELKLKQPKTKEIVAVLEALNVGRRALIVTAEKDDAVVRSSNNIQEVTTTTADFVNVYDLVANKKCVITVDAVKKIEEAYNV